MATWSLRLRPVWSLAPAGAGQLGHATLDGGVDVFVGRLERERAGRQLVGDGVQRRQHGGGLVAGQQLGAHEAPHVGP